MSRYNESSVANDTSLDPVSRAARGGAPSELARCSRSARGKAQTFSLERAVEQLAHHPKGELTLELAGARGQNPNAGLRVSMGVEITVTPLATGAA